MWPAARRLITLSAPGGADHFDPLCPVQRTAFFNLLAPNGEALLSARIKAIRADSPRELGMTGEYAIRVYLVRAAAMRGERASFSLTVSVPEASCHCRKVQAWLTMAGLISMPLPAFTPGDRLNMRRAPSAASPVITSYRNGKILRNLGCRRTATQRWCNVENLRASWRTGWVNGRFLRESAAPGSGGTQPDVGVRTQPDVGVGTQPKMLWCLARTLTQRANWIAPLRAIRVQKLPLRRHPGREQAEGTVFITLPDGDNRAFEFEGGGVRPLFGVSNFRYARSGGTWLLNVDDGQERYTVDEAVVNGG